MPEIVTSILFLLLAFSVWITRDFFHPAVLVSGLWAILLFLYLFLDHPLWDLSEDFYVAVLLWVVPFVIFATIKHKKRVKVSDGLKTNNINRDFYRLLYKYVFAYAVIFILAIVAYAGGLNFSGIRVLLVGEDLPPFINILFYLNTFMTVYVFYGILNPGLIEKGKILVLVLLLLAISMLKANKTSFLAIFVGVLYLLKKRGQLSRKTFVLLSCVLGVLLFAVTSNRADYDFESESGLENFLYIYLLSPLTAFDALLNREVILQAGTFGESLFEFFYKVLNTFGANLKISELGTGINVPLPTNVYTAMRGPYLDGGFLGIFIVSTVLACIWNKLYSLQRNNYPIYVVFYATMVSSLLFQSFGDYFFHSLSMTIQYFLFSIIVKKGVRCL